MSTLSFTYPSLLIPPGSLIGAAFGPVTSDPSYTITSVSYSFVLTAVSGQTIDLREIEVYLVSPSQTWHPIFQTASSTTSTDDGDQDSDIEADDDLFFSGTDSKSKFSEEFDGEVVAGYWSLAINNESSSDLILRFAKLNLETNAPDPSVSDLIVEVFNEAPIGTVDDQESVSGVGKLLQFVPLFSDPNDDELTFSLTQNLPLGFFFNAAAGTLYADETASAGTYQFTVNVDDGNGGTTTEDFSWTVQQTATVNHAPVWSEIASFKGVDPNGIAIDFVATVGNFISLGLDNFVSDPDGDSISIDASELPRGLVFNNTTKVVSGNLTEAGYSTFSFNATDINGNTSTYSLSAYIKENNSQSVDEPEQPPTEEVTHEALLESHNDETDGFILWVARLLGYDTVAKAKSYLAELYENNIKFVLTPQLGAGVDFGVGNISASGGVGIDLADLFQVTPEGAGGYDGNANGRVSIWSEFSGVVGKAWTFNGATDPKLRLSDLSIGFQILPIEFDPHLADDRADTRIGAEVGINILDVISVGASGSIGTKGLDGGYSVGAGLLGAEVVVNLDGDGDFSSGSSKLNLLDIDTLPAPTLSVSAGVTFENIQNVGEVDRDTIATSSIIGALSYILTATPSTLSFVDGFTGDERANTIVGTADADYIWGQGGTDKLSGEGGDDILFADGTLSNIRENAQLFGGEGSDVLHYGQYNTWRASGGAGDDTYVIHLSEMYAHSNVATSDVTAFIKDDGDGNDTLVVFTDGELELGKDIFLDEIYREGKAQLRFDKAGNNNNEVIIDLGDQLEAENQIEWIWLASDSNFTVYDRINTLRNLFPDDELLAASGDVLTNLENDAKVDGSENSDLYAASTGENELFGNGGSDRLIGGRDADVLDGGNGHDVITGDISLTGGTDRIIGGKGNDILMGSAGKDTFVFAPNEGTDHIGHFKSSDVTLENGLYSVELSLLKSDFLTGYDVIELRNFETVNESNVMNYLSEVDGSAQFVGEGTQIVFVNIPLAHLIADDFDFA